MSAVRDLSEVNTITVTQCDFERYDCLSRWICVKRLRGRCATGEQYRDVNIM